MTTFADLTVSPPDWTLQAACRYTDNPDLFVPDKPARAPGPPAECGACPVRAECLAYGQDAGLEGWWGGQPLKPNLFGAADRTKRFQDLYDAGLNDSQISAATDTTRYIVAAWRAERDLPPQVTKTAAGMVNRHGEPCCKYGHATATDSTKRDDGQLVCVTCLFGNARAA